MLKKMVFLFFLIVTFYSAYTQNEPVKICISTKAVDNISSAAKLVIYTATKNIYFNNSIYADTCITFYGIKGVEYHAMAERAGCAIQNRTWKFDTLSANATIILELNQRVITLKDVIVKADNGIKMKGDTMVIPVDKIQVRPHSNATDLIDNVPGMSVTENGGVQAMGKKIDRITIDGKEVFGGNPKAVLESVKADMVQQLEILDEGTNMNLHLKRDKHNGIYGEASITAGTTGRFSSAARINTITPTALNNIFINYNNTNERAFSPVDLFKTFNAALIAGETGLVTKKLYYTPSLLQTTEINELQNFAALTKGIRKSVSGGFNATKVLKNAEWKTYGLFYKDYASIENTKLSKQFYTPFTQEKNNTDSTKNKPAFATFESKLDWSPNDKNKIQIKLGGRYQNDNNAIVLASNSSLMNKDSVLQSTVLFNNQYYKSHHWQGVTGIYWEHKYEKPAEKTTIQCDVVYSGGKADNAYQNQLFTNGSPLLTNNNFITSKDNQSSIALRAEHSTPLNNYLLLDANAGVTMNKYNFLQQGFRIYGNENFSNPSISARNIEIANLQSYAQAFLFFKKPKFSAIVGFGILTTSYRSNNYDSLVNNTNVLTTLPHLYAEYKFNTRTKFSFTHTVGQINPDLQNVLPLPDSSNINLITKGNLYLVPYKKNTWRLDINHLTKKIGQFGLSVEYNRNNNPVIVNNNFDQNLFLTQTFVNYRSSRQWNGYLSWLFVRSQTKGINPYVFLFFINNDGYILNQNKETRFDVNSSVIISGFKWKIAPYQSLDFSLHQKFSFSEQANNSRFFLDMKSENKIAKGLFFNLRTYWLMNSSALAKENQLIKPILSCNIYKFIGSTSRWQIQLGAINIFNAKTITENYITNISQSSESYNYMPRYFSLGIKFFPEKWKD
ncbi:MAG TPA: TonB-dependent receptor [Hanamia sp.]